MARALVVYESMFGNTRAVAEAVAAGLATTFESQALDVRDAPTDLSDINVFVVGAPTHAFGLSRPRTRADAANQGADRQTAAGGGVREWIESIEPPGDDSGIFAVFDTRIRRPRVPGSAARAARRRLSRRGFRVGDAISFWVTGTPGPLYDGELDRARRWGEQLAAAIPASVSPRGTGGGSTLKRVKSVPLQRKGDYVVKMYELNPEVCATMLSRCVFGRVGFDDEHDGPTVLPVNSVYADDVLLFRTEAGSPLDRIADGRRIAFEADQIDPIAESGWSILVRGVLAHVTDERRIAALAETATHPWAPGPRDRWIEIRPERVTGRIIRRHRLATDEGRAPYMPPD